MHPCRSCPHGRRLFLQALRLRARVLAPLLLRFRPGHFAADWELVRGACRAKSEKELGDAIYHFSSDPSNDAWMREKAKIRLSARKVRQAVKRMGACPCAGS